jgi:hypothetical protein
MTSRTIFLFVAGVVTGVVFSLILFNINNNNCPIEGRISFSQAIAELQLYRNPQTNSNMLRDATGAPLYGWKIKRCKIESIFNEYDRDADGIQLYIGQKPDGSHSLLWVASGTSSDTNGPVDLFDPKDPVAIVDMTSGCPHDCPPDNSPLMSLRDE